MKDAKEIIQARIDWHKAQSEEIENSETSFINSKVTRKHGEMIRELKLILEQIENA